MIEATDLLACWTWDTGYAIAANIAVRTRSGYELSKKKALDEVLKAWRFNPASFEMDEDEKQALQKGQPQDPRIIVEQMRTQKDLQITDKNYSWTDEGSEWCGSWCAVPTRRDWAYRNDYEATIAELQLRERLAMLEYANKHQDTLDNIKAKLADSSLKLSVQRSLPQWVTMRDRL